jgi:hypothetical protein
MNANSFISAATSSERGHDHLQVIMSVDWMKMRTRHRVDEWKVLSRRLYTWICGLQKWFECEEKHSGVLAGD